MCLAGSGVCGDQGADYGWQASKFGGVAAMSLLRDWFRGSNGVEDRAEIGWSGMENGTGWWRGQVC